MVKTEDAEVRSAAQSPPPGPIPSGTVLRSLQAQKAECPQQAKGQGHSDEENPRYDQEFHGPQYVSHDTQKKGDPNRGSPTWPIYCWGASSS